MTYYKILKNGMIVDVNHLFFRVQEKHKRIVACDSKYAELIGSSDGNEFYTAYGLRQPKYTPSGVEQVEMHFISEEEYNDLKAQLEDVKEIEPPVVEIEPVSISEPAVEKDPDPIMTVAEMRTKIAKLEKIIELLMEKN